MNNTERVIKIRSRESEFIKAINFIDEIIASWNISNRYYGNILLAIEEALKNAMIHGNRHDEEKYITIEFKRIPNQLLFIITDEGEGFDFKKIQQEVFDFNFSGKGLFLIQSLANKVTFHNNGRSVEIGFIISGINPETAFKRIVCLNSYFKGQKIGAH